MTDSNQILQSEEGSAQRTLRMWVLLRLNRWALTCATLTGVFLLLVGASQIGLSPLRQIAETQDGLEFLFSAFIGAIITGTSIVVTINQLVLSQELGAVGQQRSRMSDAMDFRQDVEDEFDIGLSSPEPSAFLYELIEGIEEKANTFEDAIAEERDEDLKDEVEGYVDDVTENAQNVKDGLEEAQFGTFAVIWNALNFNYSRKIHDAREFRTEHGDSLSEESNEAIEDLVDQLKFFGPAREHFKTLYFQWELINLSRALLYIAVPALTVMGIMILYVDAGTMQGATLGVDNLVWLTSAGFVVGTAPFVVFIAYVLRIATVAKRTLAMGPFILRESERDDDPY